MNLFVRLSVHAERPVESAQLAPLTHGESSARRADSVRTDHVRVQTSFARAHLETRLKQCAHGAETIAPADSADCLRADAACEATRAVTTS